MPLKTTHPNNFLGLSLVIGTLVLQGCVTTNPATGQSDFTPFMSPAKEASVGKEQHPLVVEQHGGVVDDPQVAGYVAVVGGRLARVSEMPLSPFTFTVLNSPIVNAFALPGGYVYITRGMLQLLNSESELAAVLGHEIGHITARHSAKRYNTQIFTGLGASILGAVIKNDVIGSAIDYGSQLYLKSYSRGNEYESDDLGVRYASRAGFDPYGASTMLKSLEASSQLQDMLAQRTGQNRPPEFFSTHPNTKDRTQRARAAAQQTGMTPKIRPNGQNPFLTTLNGMIYGDDPSQGVIDGRKFAHRALRLSFTVPPNYQLINSTDAIYAKGVGPADGGVVLFAGEALKGRHMMTFTADIWSTFVKDATLGGLESLPLNGMDAISGYATTKVNKIDSLIQLVTIHHSDDQAYYFLMITPRSLLEQQSDGLSSMIHSFRKLTPSQAQNIPQKIIKVITVKPGDTTSGLAQKMVFDSHRRDRFMVLNGLTPDSNIYVGQRLKLVVYK